jgi:hypothetical protein
VGEGGGGAVVRLGGHRGRDSGACVVQRLLGLLGTALCRTRPLLGVGEPACGGLQLLLDLGHGVLRARPGHRLGSLRAGRRRVHALLGRGRVALGLLRGLEVAGREARTLGSLLARGRQLVTEALALTAQLGQLVLEHLAGAACGALLLDGLLEAGLELRALLADALQLRARDLQRELSL